MSETPFEEHNSDCPDSLNNNTVHRKHWKARLLVTYIMLTFGFSAFLILNFNHRSLWFFSQIVAGVFGLTSIGLHWYIRRSDHIVSTSSVWHQVLHWIGLGMMIYIISIFISTGFITSTQAGVLCLAMLSLSVFIAGVYTDPALLLVGITLAIYTASSTLFPNHLVLKLIPVTLIAAFCLFLLIHQQRRHAEKASKVT